MGLQPTPWPPDLSSGLRYVLQPVCTISIMKIIQHYFCLNVHCSVSFPQEERKITHRDYATKYYCMNFKAFVSLLTWNYSYKPKTNEPNSVVTKEKEEEFTIFIRFIQAGNPPCQQALSGRQTKACNPKHGSAQTAAAAEANARLLPTTTTPSLSPSS